MTKALNGETLFIYGVLINITWGLLKLILMMFSGSAILCTTIR